MLSSNLLTGEKIKLTALTEHDLQAVTAWHQDLEFLRHLDAIPAKPRTHKSIVKLFEDMMDSDKNVVFAIRRLENDNLLGFISLEAILWNHRVAWLAMGIGNKEHRGQGFGQEAIRLAVAFAFQELNLHRVQLSVFEYNEPGIRAYEKMGFTREGSYREFMERDGKRYDMHIYGLLRHEWETHQA